MDLPTVIVYLGRLIFAYGYSASKPPFTLDTNLAVLGPNMEPRNIVHRFFEMNNVTTVTVRSFMRPEKTTIASAAKIYRP